jgi:hypothetical protein
MLKLYTSMLQDVLHKLPVNFMFPLRAHAKHGEINFGNSLHVAIAVQRQGAPFLTKIVLQLLHC